MVEYILSIIIMAVFFSVICLLVNSMINNADQIVVEQELGVVAHDIANRISGFSQTVSANQHQSIDWESDVSGYSELIDLPDLVGGKPYTIETTYDPGTLTYTVKVSYGMNPNVYRSVSFRSAIDVVVPAMIASTSANPQIKYDPLLNKIQMVG